MSNFDAMALYKSQRGEQVSYKLDSIFGHLKETPKEVLHDCQVDHKNYYYQRPSKPPEQFADYSLYNLQYAAMEELFAIQKQIREFIKRKRRKDPNFNVTFKRKGEVLTWLSI